MTSRRRFLRQTAAAAATTTLGFPAILRCASPNSMLQVAGVGVSHMGGVTIKSVSTHDKVKFVALCDVDAGYLAQTGNAFPDAAIKVADWRELLAKHADKFDAITVGVPDHSHAPIAVSALRLKKHVYLQKPMAPTLHECRIITEEAVKAGVVTQLGNQGRSTVESRLAVELLRSGAIGKVKEVHIWENKPLNWWPKNEELRPQGDPIPEGFDWNLWQGVRTPRPYLADTYAPQTWRAWRDFGTGELGDMGCHHFDPTFDALKLTAPLRVRQTEVQESKPGMWAKSHKVEFKFAANELISGETLKITWYDNLIKPDPALIPLPKVMQGKEFPHAGSCWIGEHGTLFKEYTKRPYVLPEEDFPAEKYPHGFGKQDHYHDWVNAILEGRKSCADFRHGGPLTETVLCGTLTEKFPNQWLAWDRDRMKITNMPEANELVKRDYRDGWKIEGLG
jgi:predicted dehydrogenase